LHFQRTTFFADRGSVAVADSLQEWKTVFVLWMGEDPKEWAVAKVAG
jgi:hypothetical protein